MAGGADAAIGGRANRGPSAAAENRAALIAAARVVFAQAGYDAPLNAVARVAGVGQGSLYRHFPHRADLALAVFDENVVAIEQLAARPDATLADVLRIITDQALESTAFIHMITESNDPRIRQQLGGRLHDVLNATTTTALASGELRAGTTVDDVELAVVMVTGAIASTPAAERRVVADRSWQLLALGMPKQL